jgi:hypothetical protein
MKFESRVLLPHRADAPVSKLANIGQPVCGERLDKSRKDLVA